MGPFFGHEIHISTPKVGQNSHFYSLMYRGGRGYTSLGNNPKKQTIFLTSFLILWAFSLSIFGCVKGIAHAQVLHCLATLLTSFTFLSSSHQILLYRFVCGVGWDWGEDVSAKVRSEETTQGLRRLHVFTQYTTLLVYEDGWKSKITYLGRF